MTGDVLRRTVRDGMTPVVDRSEHSAAATRKGSAATVSVAEVTDSAPLVGARTSALRELLRELVRTSTTTVPR